MQFLQCNLRPKVGEEWRNIQFPMQGGISSIGRTGYAVFLDRNFINLGRNKLTPMTS